MPVNINRVGRIFCILQLRPLQVKTQKMQEMRISLSLSARKIGVSKSLPNENVENAENSENADSKNTENAENAVDWLYS